MIMLDLAHHQMVLDEETTVAWSMSLVLNYTLHHVYAFSQHGVYHDGGKIQSRMEDCIL